MGDDEAKTETNMAMTARLPAWKRQQTDTLDSQVNRAVRQASTRVHRVCDTAYKISPDNTASVWRRIFANKTRSAALPAHQVPKHR